jgi:hypothetical protein
MGWSSTLMGLLPLMRNVAITPMPFTGSRQIW